MDIKEPLVSIIIPIYGVEKYIGRCAKSLFEQTYQNIEYIFVNDCTKDNSIDILKQIIHQYPNRSKQIKIINHNQNGGLAKARLTGIEHATGDYIWCVDSDDFVEKKVLDICYNYMISSYDIIMFNFYEEKHGKIQNVPQHDLSVNNVLLYRVAPNIWKCLIKKDLLYSNSIFPIEGIDFSEDYILLSRLILKSKKHIFLKNQFLYHYNCDNAVSYMSNISDKSRIDMAKGILVIYDYYEKNNYLKKYSGQLFYILALRYLGIKNIETISSIKEKLEICLKRLNPFMFHIIRNSYVSDFALNIYRKYIIFKSLSTNRIL